MHVMSKWQLKETKHFVNIDFLLITRWYKKKKLIATLHKTEKQTCLFTQYKKLVFVCIPDQLIDLRARESVHIKSKAS